MKTVLFHLCMLLTTGTFAQTDGRYFSMEAALKEPEKVLYLELFGEQLIEVPDEVKKFINVKEIVLRNNNIMELPKWFGKLKHLEELSLGNNPHLDHDQVFSVLKKIPQLNSLDLEQTNLKELPKNANSLKSIKKLFLGLNGLTEAEIGQIRNRFPNITIYN